MGIHIGIYLKQLKNYTSIHNIYIYILLANVHSR